MDRLNMVIAGVVAAIVAALTGANILTPVVSPVGNGLPDEEILKEVTDAGGYVIAIQTMEPSGPKPRGGLARTAATELPVSIVATVTGNLIAFSGTLVAGVGVHVLLAAPGAMPVDTPFVTAAGETAITFASRVAATINTFTGSAGLVGVSAFDNGDGTITIEGSPSVQVGVANSFAAGLRVNTKTQRLQITTWAADKLLRDRVNDVILYSIGTYDPDSQFLAIGDGSFARSQYASGSRDTDEQVEMRSLKRGDILIDVRYDLIKPITLTQIVVNPVTVETDSAETTILTVGGTIASG